MREVAAVVVEAVAVGAVPDTAAAPDIEWRLAVERRILRGRVLALFDSLGSCTACSFCVWRFAYHCGVGRHDFDILDVPGLFEWVIGCALVDSVCQLADPEFSLRIRFAYLYGPFSWGFLFEFFLNFLNTWPYWRITGSKTIRKIRQNRRFLAAPNVEVYPSIDSNSNFCWQDFIRNGKIVDWLQSQKISEW